MRSAITIFAAALAAGTANAASSWVIPMGEQVNGGFDRVQILMADPYKFDTAAMGIFFGPSPVGESWSQTFQNPGGTYAVAQGPTPGNDAIHFVINVTGNTAVDRPAFFFQAYLGSTRVDNVNILCTGPNDADWVIQPGTWTASHAFPPWIPGDADFDTDVDIHDAIIWQANYTGPGALGHTWGQGDWNEDGAVDIHDMLLWQANYTGPHAEPGAIFPQAQFNAIMSSVTAVPEPTSLSVLAVGTVALLRRRRRA